eukprot:6067453-Prymnesium_polylepis.1
MRPSHASTKRPRTVGRYDKMSFDRAYREEYQDLDEGHVGLMMRICERTFHPLINRLTDALGLRRLCFHCEHRAQREPRAHCCLLALDRVHRGARGVVLARKGASNVEPIGSAVALDEAFFSIADKERAALAIVK